MWTGKETNRVGLCHRRTRNHTCFNHLFNLNAVVNHVDRILKTLDWLLRCLCLCKGGGDTNSFPSTTVSQTSKISHGSCGRDLLERGSITNCRSICLGLCRPGERPQLIDHVLHVEGAVFDLCHFQLMLIRRKVT